MIARHEGFIRNKSRLDTVQVGANLIPQGTTPERMDKQRSACL